MGARPLEVTPIVTDEPGQLEEGMATSNSTSNSTSSRPQTSRRGIRRCRKCDDNYKPPRAHHDSVTGRCIVKMDHFCPWVGNAVGALNHKYFFLFILYTMITSVLSLVLLGIRTIRCGYMVKNDGGRGGGNGGDEGDSRWLIGVKDDSDDETGYDYKYPGCDELYTLATAALLVISLMFMIFTCIMLAEQIEAITSNTGKIARMKIRAGRGDVHELAPVGANHFNEMFGSGLGGGSSGSGPDVSLHWFLPWVKVQFPDGMNDAVMGYEYDPSWGNAPYREPDEDEFQSEPLRAGGAAVAVPPLVSQSASSAADDDASNSELHSTASTRGSSNTGTRKRSSSRTRGPGTAPSSNGGGQNKQTPQIV